MALNDGIEYLGFIFIKIKNVFLFGLSFLSAQIIINPYGTFAQKDFFFIEDDAAVVVNLLPSRPFNLIRDLYHLLKYLFTGNNASHQKISDKRFNFILSEVKEMITGCSSLKGFEGKKISEKVFYFKGHEHLTAAQKEQLSSFVSQDERKINFYSVESSDGAVLDSVEYDASKNSLENQQYMICCNPRDVNYSLYLKDGFLKNISTASGSKVIAFNYRGIDRSQGLILTEQALIDDTVAQVQRLLTKGIDAKSITLYGFCLGGAIATLAAGDLKKQGIEVRLYNDRSFLSISKFVIGILCPEQANTPIAWIRTFFAVLFYPIIWVLIKLSGWQMDAQSAWSSIDDKYKMYSVVKTVENLEVKQKDGVIHTSLASISSLYLKQEDTNDKCFGFDARLNQHCFFNDGHFLKPSQLQHEQSTITDSIVGFLGRSIMV